MPTLADWANIKEIGKFKASQTTIEAYIAAVDIELDAKHAGDPNADPPVDPTFVVPTYKLLGELLTTHYLMDALEHQIVSESGEGTSATVHIPAAATDDDLKRTPFGRQYLRTIRSARGLVVKMI